MAQSSQSVGCRVMTFTPSKEEFKDFGRYIAFMESQGAHRAGMAKVIPPKGWKPRKTYDDIDDLVIPAPIQQVVTGQSGLFTQYNIQKKPMTVHDFRKTSNMDKFCSPRYVDFDELERKFWKNLTFNPPLYGADVSGTLYDPDVTEWNIGHLNTILDIVENESGIKIKGVNTPYLYFGMWKSAFAWHTEDMDLYSINYLHFGEPKSWYVVPPEHGKRLERLAKGFFPGNVQGCEAFLRHKMTLISPFILKKYGIPFEKVTQEAGQFIVTFPFGYHAGFNHGFNCAESTNFATQRWIDYGKQATLCSCRQDMVKISMDVFVRKFQPERYKLWKAGKDNAPIDHSKPTPEAAEFLKEDKKLEPSKESPAEVPPEEPNTPVQEDKRSGFISKSQSKANAKKTSNRRSPLKKEKNCVVAMDVSASEPTENQVVSLGAEETGGSEEPPLGNSCSKMFQRTLSPADVLHVHSYAKGDYGDGEVLSREEKKSEDSDHETEEDNSRVGKAVSGHIFNIVSYPFIDHSKCVVFAFCASETPEEPPPVEAGGVEGEGWAKPLAHLWQSRPPNLKKEREYNQRIGSKPPYCSICLLFHTYHQVISGRTECANSIDTHVMVAGERMRTKPLIPEMCFTTTTEDDAECEEQPVPPRLEEDGTSLLISCSQCSVRVHACQYTHVRLHTHILFTSEWVHVLCAVAVLEARFVNITERSPVDLSGIPLQRFKLKCYYCKKRMKKASGCCVQCSHGRCPTAYHPTCAQAAGVLMQPDEWPFVVHVTCCRHKGPAQIERNKAAMHELTVGQKVICKHKNGRYYQCDVVQLSKETFYEVNFDDGSFSDNLFPEDIVSRDCAQLGPPPQGEVVQVRWTDGLVYGAKFVAAHVIQMYLVEFEDGSQLTAKRDDVYSLDEELPKRVKTRLSKASDMRFDGIFEEKEIIQESKRQRVINSRYRGDYIEPLYFISVLLPLVPVIHGARQVTAQLLFIRLYLQFLNV
uniref:[histone H3]-trimethyl-L-lysine(9) demethylase n=1 Tax=Oreochromis niloticus TaxID=8128 RepID=A0A669CW17_ORENI